MVARHPVRIYEYVCKVYLCGMLPLIDLTPGDVYEPKVAATPVICMQVGVGQDLGIFLGECVADTFTTSPKFRVPVNTKDLKRHWKKVAHLPLAPGLNEYASYGYLEIGTPLRYRVSLENMERMEPIDQAAYDKLERLSVYETVHIYRRLREGVTWK
jgi:hypothetical protein